MYKSILLPIDLGNVDKSQAALELAGNLVEDGTSVRLLNVIMDIPAYIAAELPGNVANWPDTRPPRNYKSSAVSLISKPKSRLGRERRAQRFLLLPRNTMQI